MSQNLRKNHMAAKGNYLFLLLVLTGINIVLTFAGVLQLVKHELPCPLCLLQRLAFFGAGFGLVSAFRRGYTSAHTGCVQIFMLYLLVVSARQCLNHIVSGSGWIGGSLLGLHLSVWSVVAALVMLLLFSLQLTVFLPRPRTAGACMLDNFR